MIKIGMIIGDRYEILEKIGTGGMSDVYKAKCHKLNRFVAVKVLKQEFSENANFVSKFRIEAQAAAGLMHPNIVNVYDVGEENGIYYIVMELVEGITLKKYIEKKARLSVKEAISIAIQICMGIEAAHNNHIIHRDIKPQNIIISKEGKVKVTDFGIAKAATSNTITSNVMGSVHYTSPEQARGGFSDAKSDIYSLGITLFEMLTGRVAFNGETTVAIAIKHIQEEMPSPRDYVAEIPVSVEQIVFKCCQKSPDRRYQTMGDLIADLKKSLMNPDEDFVKVIDPDEEASTRAISELEMAQIKKQSRRRDSLEDAIRTGQDARYQDGEGDEKGYNTTVYNTTVYNTGEEADYDPDEEYYEEADEEYEEEYIEEYDEEDDDEVDGEDDYDPKMEKVGSVLAIVAAIVIGAIVIILVGRAFGIFNFDFLNSNKDNQTEQTAEDNRQVTMISVTGKTLDEAKIALIELGLTPEIVYEESMEYAVGIVMSANVSQGTMVDVGSNVVLTVSTGSTGVAVPDVVGKTEAEATAALEKEGFSVSRTEGYDIYIKQGSVLSQSPAAGSKAPKGSAITIRVSLGAEENKVQVPDLMGQTEMDAMVVLQEAGLVMGTVTEANHDDPALAGLVCYQSYSIGSYVEKGTIVDLRVSVGPTQELYQYTGSITAPTVAEDPYYKAGIVVTVTVTADDGTQLLSTQVSSFPLPVDYANIKAPSGFILYQYTVTTDAQAITQEDGTVVNVEGTTEQREIVRSIEFTKQ